MRKLNKILMFVLCLLLVPSLVKAGSGTITVSGSSQAVVGNTVTITVKLSSGTGIGSWQMQLNYDKSYLQLTSSSAEAGGTVMANSSTSGIKSKSYTFKFKTLKTGSTKVSVSSYEAYAFSDMSEISLTGGSKTIKIITQQELEASYSKDNNLKNLTVEGYELTPAFSKDTLNYVVNVPEGTTSVNIKAEKSDSKSTVSGDGTIEVSEGTNNVAITVRAENGSEKTYNVAVNVIDQNPINVNVDNTNFTVVKLRNNYHCPDLFTESEVTIDGFQIPSCVNEKIDYTLVGLKKDDGTVINYIYNDNKYTQYIETTGTSLKVIILDSKNPLKGYEKVKATIDDHEYNVFKYNGSKNYVVYGINIETGVKDFYVYDTVNKTFSTYDKSEVEDLEKQNETYLYVIIAFGSALLLSFVCLISLSSSKKKLKKMILNNSEIVKNINKEEKQDKKKKKEKKIESEEEKTDEVKKEEDKGEEIKEEKDQTKTIEITNDEDDDEFLRDVSPKEKKKRDKQRKKEEKKRLKEEQEDNN